MKELTLLLEFMLKSKFYNFRDIIAKDFALLLSFQKIFLNEYLNITKSEEQNNDDKNRFCNFELALIDSKLPLFGPDKLVVRYISDK